MEHIYAFTESLAAHGAKRASCDLVRISHACGSRVRSKRDHTRCTRHRALPATLKTHRYAPWRFRIAKDHRKRLRGSLTVSICVRPLQGRLKVMRSEVDEKKSSRIDQSWSGLIECIDGGIGTTIDCSPKAHSGADTSQKRLFEPSRGVRREV